MATKKKYVKWIREKCKELPAEFYPVYNRYHRVMFEKTVIDGEDKLVPVYGEVDKCPVNHTRRAKKMWNMYGRKGLEEYFAKYGVTLTGAPPK